MALVALHRGLALLQTLLAVDQFLFSLLYQCKYLFVEIHQSSKRLNNHRGVLVGVVFKGDYQVLLSSMFQLLHRLPITLLGTD